MNRIFAFLWLMLPMICFSQVRISGTILNQADKKPVANASVFLSNTSLGGKTADNGAFELTHVKPGKYEIVVSVIGFEPYRQSVTVTTANIELPAINMVTKVTLLSEVKIKPVNDASRNWYLDWFKEAFLGTSSVAKDCKILNPELLDFDYDEKTDILTASSSDFLDVINPDLGYKLKYLVTKFTLARGAVAKVHLSYVGSVLFEEMKGSPAQEKRWLKRRQEVYEGSMMHFLRAVLSSNMDREGFRVLRIASHPNPARPVDSLIEAKIKFYTKAKSDGGVTGARDSLSMWEKKTRLPKMVEELVTVPLSPGEFIKKTDQQGLFALGLAHDSDALYISYDKYRHFDLWYNKHATRLDDPGNISNTRVNFYTPYAFFDNNGMVANPTSLLFGGVWGRSRVAELLPFNYEPPQGESIQEDTAVTRNIIAKLNNFTATHDQEKAYLQFDKSRYGAGDTMYFKAYVTKADEHRLSALSGVLHVDLINTKDKIDQSIKLKLDSGIAWGDFALPDSLPQGNYRVRAYTQWMRNDGDAAFFNKMFPVGSTKAMPVPESMAKQQAVAIAKPDVQFFPEGGSLVTGVRSKVAFKVTAADGLGINVTGSITDNDNNQVTSFASSHFGMGYFYLTPADGKTYRAKISYPNGQQDEIDLPKPVPDGIVLSINNDSLPKATVRVETSTAYFQNNQHKNYTLVIYSGGLVTMVNCKLDSQVIKLDILKRRLHTGVATVTLFSAQSEPLIERLLFVQNYDALTLGVNTDKNSYAKKETVNIRLNALNRRGEPSEGHFSVSVTDENITPESGSNGDNILTGLLLTSDLKGYVEHPDDYFADTSMMARKNLDVLMLTQGFRRFTWKQVLDTTKQTPVWQPEKGMQLAGQVKSLFNNPVKDGTVTLVPSDKSPLLTSTTDEKGMYHFSNLVFSDTAHFVLSAVTGKNKNSTKISYFGDRWGEPVVGSFQNNDILRSDTSMAAYLVNDRGQLGLLKEANSKAIKLKQVEIRGARTKDAYFTLSLAGAGHADQVMQANEIERVPGQLVTSLLGRLHGVTFYNNKPYLVGIGFMFVVVDGMEGAQLDDYNFQATDVQTVEVLKSAAGLVYGGAGAHGVLVITTKQGGGQSAKNIVSIGVLPIAPVGFYKAREFYSPKYDHPDMAAKQRDLRSTIYWKPEIMTDKEGNASFEYYNADGTGTYKVVVEGIDKDGNIGRQVYRYKVE